MRVLSAREKDLIIENVDRLIFDLDRKISRIYSEAYLKRSQEMERYLTLPWYKKVFIENPSNSSEVNCIYKRVTPFENCIGELIMVKSKFPVTAIININITNDHYEQYQKAIQESQKLLK